MSHFLLGQLIGCVAVCLSLAVFQTNKRKGMLHLAAVSSLLYAVSFFLLHAYTGAALNLIAAARCFTFTKSRSRKDSIRIFILFALLSTAASYATWAGTITLLALIGTLFNGMAAGQLKTKNMRRYYLIAPPLWFCYNFIAQSYPGMFVEVFILVSNCIGQYRFDFSKKRQRALRPALESRKA